MSNEKKLLHKSCNRNLYCFFITRSKKFLYYENFLDKIKSYKSILESIIFED